MGKCIPSESKEEIEGIVNEIIEKIEPLLENEVLEEIREYYKSIPRAILKSCLRGYTYEILSEF